MIKKLALSLVCLSAAVAATPAFADRAIGTEWFEVEGGAVRLIRASTPEDDGTYKAGLEFQLEPGWHTYWRYPGEAGIPTEANFNGSTNLANAELLFPAPKRYSDGFSTSLIYDGNVILPLKLQRQSDARTTVLNMTVTFGVCQHICIPEQQELSLVLPRHTTEDAEADAIIEAAFAKLPAQANGNAPVTEIAVVPTDSTPVITFSAPVSTTESTAYDLFVEGPEGSYNSVPKRLESSDHIARWQLPLTGFPKDLQELDLRLTLITPQGAVEQEAALSLPPRAKEKRS
ncbi:protein-disulfide reductase DsbD family protein [Pseudovibrio exalbescens]|uniref:protein-disulfide reductase DsbD domain-containing protein n=1 Tax=Pseudovibrio exalbescens TaxID=197461 RepID=UPI0023673283|nr:protein-disulfide reductase DsbD domain-containing protein [Pseudovibrio exalbescens]MDD7911293.1 protein-disulfide reductase DsbD family protein [Pseudovibrio exalbescens]